MRPYFCRVLILRFYEYPVPAFVKVVESKITTTFLSVKISGVLNDVRRARLDSQEGMNALAVHPGDGCAVNR